MTSILALEWVLMSNIRKLGEQRQLFPQQSRFLAGYPTRVVAFRSQLDVKVPQEFGQDQTKLRICQAVTQVSEKSKKVKVNLNLLPMQSRGPYENGCIASGWSFSNDPAGASSLVFKSFGRNRSGKKSLGRWKL